MLVFALTLGLFAHQVAPQDFDKDGVADVDDDCPTDPGNTKNRGCPGNAPPPPPEPEPATEGRVEVSSDRLQLTETVLFKSGSARVDPRSFGLLKDVATAILGLPADTKISVEGHTDDRGSRKLNRALSKKRARAVIAHLVRHGIAHTRLKAKGHGPDEPIASNATAGGRKKNRRVDFIIE